VNAGGIGHGAVIGLAVAFLLLPGTVRAQGLEGFRDRPWGTPWDAGAIAALPGCETQGELVADVGSYLARVAQPDCVGYRFSEHHRVNLILLYPDIKWRSFDQSRSLVDQLRSERRMWGLSRETVATLDRVSAQLAALAPLRRLHGADGPVFPDMGDAFDLPGHVRGLQGYQINFATAQYDAMRSRLVIELGRPTRTSRHPVSGETLEWRDDSARATLKERGGADASGYLAVVTTRYLDFLAAQKGVTGDSTRPLARAATTLRPNVMSYPWFVQVFEWFDWARDP